MSKKAWGGRFEEELNQAALRFSSSVDFDKKLAFEDIEGSLAHVQMLGSQKILPSEDVETIVEGLHKVRSKIESDQLLWDTEKEDVHMNIEAALIEEIGPVGGKLHTGRSRNDQVATDMRLWTRKACDKIIQRIDDLLAVLCVQSAKQIDKLFPGYTHLQRAQPVRVSHHLLAWGEMFERDRGRLEDAKKRLNECPLGSGALAATTFPIDREKSAQALGFDRPTRNSLDAVADRDFLLETLSALSICAIHLSRICEELILWNTQEFGFIEMSDAFTTGSSMMPQKKNPDMAELIRGKTGRVIGDLMSLLVLMKGLPLTYNRDMQEDKPPAFDAFETVQDSLTILTGLLATTQFKEEVMKDALDEGFLNATEIADWLVEKNVPFRDAHHVSGRLVAKAHTEGKTLSELSLADFQKEHQAFDASIFEALNMETAVEKRDVLGGPAKKQVLFAIDALKNRLTKRNIDPQALFDQHQHS